MSDPARGKLLIKSLSKVSQKPLKSLSKVSQKSLKSTSKFSQKSLKSLSNVSQKSLKSLSKVSQKPHKSLSKASHKSLKSLSKVIVAEINSLSVWLTEWQGHLLSCPGQLKGRKYLRHNMMLNCSMIYWKAREWSTNVAILTQAGVSFMFKIPIKFTSQGSTDEILL